MLLTFSRERGARAAAAALSVFALVGLVGCSAGEDGPKRAVSAAQARWEMPLAEFQVYPAELENYAEQLLIGECLTAAGYEWPVPWRDTEFPLPANINPSGRWLFDVAIAERWGYHAAPVPDPAEVREWEEFRAFASTYAPDAEFDATFTACADASRDPASAEYIDGWNWIVDLVTQANDEATNDETVEAAAEKWRDCLAPQVDFEVPDNPWSEMPPLAVANEFGLTGDLATAVASPEEIRVAVADARCRDESGATIALYEAEHDAQERLVTENRARLERLRTDTLAHKESLMAVVGEHAPAAPQ
ncbi:UNVERIFIED_CONTAM: hypothetical protein OHV15_05915 [Microbacterium sp. SLM126]